MLTGYRRIQTEHPKTQEPGATTPGSRCNPSAALSLSFVNEG